LISLFLHFKTLNERRTQTRNASRNVQQNGATSSATSAPPASKKPDTLDKATVDAFPLASFQKESSSECNETCPICIDEYHDGESVKVLPCGHIYHPLCIEPWFLAKSTACPLCKADVREFLAEQKTKCFEEAQKRKGGIFRFLGGVFSTNPKPNVRSDEVVNV
jgi:hypothetical protein